MADAFESQNLVAAAQATNIESAAQEAANDDKKKSKDPVTIREYFRLYLAPAMLFIGSLLIVFYVLLPIAQDISAGMDNISVLQQQYQTQSDLKKTREKLASETNQQELALVKISSLIPETQTAVTQFRQQVGERSQNSQLQITESVFGEVVVLSTTGRGNTQPSGLELIEIPAEFTINGKLNNIRRFLSGLYGSNDFIIIKKMELQKQITQTTDAQFSSVTTDNWTMNIVLTKYQFKLAPGVDETKIKQYYFSIPDTVRANKEVLEFIDKTYQ